MLIPQSIQKDLPSIVKRELSSMSANEQQEFVEEFTRKSKDIGTAYMLYFIGFQYSYVRKYGLQVLYFLTIYGLFLWLLIDLFRIPSMIRNYNKDVAIDVLRNIKAISG